MNRKLQLMVTASAASVLAFSALAQDTLKLSKDRPDYAREGVDHARGDQSLARRANRLNGAVRASEIMGLTVDNYQNQKLGKVDDLVVDVESGRTVLVILYTGGFIGIGDSLSVVPPGVLHYDIVNKVLHLDANKEKLKGAPKFETSKWAECCDSNHLSAVYGYYGEDPAFRFIDGGNATLDGQRNLNRQSSTDGSPNRDFARRTEGILDKDRFSKERQSMIPASRLGQLQKASKLMGTPVKNLQDENLGKVENLLLDLSAGRIVAVIVSSGGFLGMGDELSAVPPTALRFNTARDVLQLDATKETLSSAPHFKANQWPELSNPVYADGVYRAYRVEPYFTTNGVMAPDNTARNVRDRNDRTPTALYQGNSQTDIDTTAQIRKEILAGKNMSSNARNVEIITNNGRVTLRGPVNTAEEKRLIGEIATRIVRSANVDNQLEVKVTPDDNN